ncbi:GNAT family N-acetyltransferase [Shewanella salipaludis]|uniref:GNAT family N-acetyltransferase n=1 Tax=Shewanella salipaludis TaxID=2723052 RepID=UPI001B7CF8E1|nr:N-acetyltransferase [Shewanella salipaludis]
MSAVILSSPCVCVRPATRDELAQIYRLECVVFGEHCYPDFFFRQSLDCWPAGLLVALDAEQRLLGYLLAVTSERQGQLWILSVAVSPEMRGRGIGAALVRALLQAVPAGATQILLTVDPANPAVHLYLRLGFVETGFEADYFGEGEPRLVMTHRLDCAA